jgi:hypothetical protein
LLFCGSRRLGLCKILCKADLPLFRGLYFFTFSPGRRGQSALVRGGIFFVLTSFSVFPKKMKRPLWTLLMSFDKFRGIFGGGVFFVAFSTWFGSFWALL